MGPLWSLGGSWGSMGVAGCFVVYTVRLSYVSVGLTRGLVSLLKFCDGAAIVLPWMYHTAGLGLLAEAESAESKRWLRVRYLRRPAPKGPAGCHTMAKQFDDGWPSVIP